MPVSDIAPLIAQEHDDIVPLIGAGLGVAAGLPSADELGEVLRERTGLEIEAAESFGAVCREIERLADLNELQRLAGEAIRTFKPDPTSSLMAIARCPSALILTTNYDKAIERSVEEIGRKPVPLCLDNPRIGEAPKEGEVFIVHLHGVAERPETMILTTAQRSRLIGDETFRYRLRSLVLGRRVVALGLRLSAEEPHLRAALRTLGSVAAERQPLVILPGQEIDEELSILDADRLVELHRCDPSQDYLEVRQCAQLIAPRQADPVDAVAAQAPRVSPPFLPPPLLGPDQLTDSRDPFTSAMMAESHLGSWAELRELADARRACLVAAPGRGKTWALRALGEANAGRAVFCDLRGLRLDKVDPARAFAQLAVREGAAFDEQTAVPSREALREGSYLFLLDGLEEASLADHPKVVAVIVAAAEQWPQHAYVVATRPTAGAELLLEGGFLEFVLEGSEGWGRRYLIASGATEEQIDRLFDIAPTIGTQLAIPRYAARIADELREETEQGVPLARGALERLMRGERRNLEEAAQRLGIELTAMVSWARKLAAVVELRSQTSATIADIEALPGPIDSTSNAVCEELVQVALLRDLPDRARFTAQVSQEALCADAILASADPLAALARLTMAQVDGRLVFRDDIEHTLDLVFEGAPGDLRAQLREFDELRWARTQRGGDPQEVAEAIKVLRDWHRQRRLWIPYRGDNQLRGPGEAVKALHRAAPEVLSSMRTEIESDCRAMERTARGNAVELLTLLPVGEQTESILGALLADPDDVVRRHAAHAVEHFKLSGLSDELWAAWEAERDELALQAIGLALVELLDAQELPAAIGLLRKKRRGWQRISHQLLHRLELSTVASLLASGSLALEDARVVLDHRLEQSAPLGATEAEALGAILLLGGGRSGPGEGERIAETLAEHPEAALRGAEIVASDEASFLDLFWASGIDPKVLAGFAAGPLGDQIAALLERVQWRERSGRQPQSPEADEEASEPNRPGNLAEILDILGEENVPTDYWLMKLPQEDEEVQRRVFDLAEGWYPYEPATATNGFRAAVVSWTVLDHRVDETRWLAILGAGIGHYVVRVDEWLARQWNDRWAGAAAARIGALENPNDLALAARAIPEWTPELRSLFIKRLCELRDETLSITVIQRLKELDDIEGLREVLARGCDEASESRALLELARLGDVAAQRQLLESLLADAEADPGRCRDYEQQWLGTVRSPALVPLLGQILRATHRSNDASIFRRIVEAGIRNIGDPSCLALYDELIADSELEGGQFYWYQREALARSMARREVLDRIEAGGQKLLEEVLG